MSHRSTKPVPRIDLGILSGEDSRDMWDLINSIPRRKTRDAVFILGCRCQELESALESALMRIAALEGKSS